MVAQQGLDLIILKEGFQNLPKEPRLLSITTPPLRVSRVISC